MGGRSSRPTSLDRVRVCASSGAGRLAAVEGERQPRARSHKLRGLGRAAWRCAVAPTTTDTGSTARDAHRAAGLRPPLVLKGLSTPVPQLRVQLPLPTLLPINTSQCLARVSRRVGGPARCTGVSFRPALTQTWDRPAQSGLQLLSSLPSSSAAGGAEQWSVWSPTTDRMRGTSHDHRYGPNGTSIHHRPLPRCSRLPYKPRFVSWNERHRRSAPAGPSGSGSPCRDSLQSRQREEPMRRRASHSHLTSTVMTWSAKCGATDRPSTLSTAGPATAASLPHSCRRSSPVDTESSSSTRRVTVGRLRVGSGRAHRRCRNSHRRSLPSSPRTARPAWSSRTPWAPPPRRPCWATGSASAGSSCLHRWPASLPMPVALSRCSAPATGSTADWSLGSSGGSGPRLHQFRGARTQSSRGIAADADPARLRGCHDSGHRR